MSVSNDTLTVGDFALRIVHTKKDGGAAYPMTDDRYVVIKTGDEYAFELTNKTELLANAYVTIDGVDMGLFQLLAHNTWAVERPGGKKDARVFTAVVVDSKEAEDAGVEKGHKDNGLIKVVIKPQKKPAPVAYSESYSLPKCYHGMAKGAGSRDRAYAGPSHAVAAGVGSRGGGPQPAAAYASYRDRAEPAGAGLEAVATTLGRDSDQTFGCGKWIDEGEPVLLSVRLGAPKAKPLVALRALADPAPLH